MLCRDPECQFLDPIDVGVCYCGCLASSIFLWFLPSSSSGSSCLPFSGLGSSLPWFLRCSPRRHPGRAPWLSPFVLVVRRVVAGLRGRRWDPLWVPWFCTPLVLGLVGGLRSGGSRRAVFLLPRIFNPYLVDFSQGLYSGHFYGISELRGARQVERFAQCSFRHLQQVVFHLAGSLGVFLIFAAPDPGGC